MREQANCSKNTADVHSCEPMFRYRTSFGTKSSALGRPTPSPVTLAPGPASSSPPSMLTLRRVDHGFSLPHRSIIRDESERARGAVVEDGCRQRATKHGTGIQVKPIG